MTFTSLNQSTRAFLRMGIILSLFTSVAAAQASNQITLDFPETHNVLVLTVPEEPAALKVDLLNLQVKGNDLRQDLSGRRLQAGNKLGWEFSSFLYPRGTPSNSKELRESMLENQRKGAEKAGYKLEQVKQYERGPIAMLEYNIETFKGAPVHQKNVFGYLISGSLGLDFHLSKIAFQSEDQKFMDSFVGGISLLENYEPDSKTQFGYGSIYYLQRNWPKAITHLQKALDAERRKATLAPDEWRVLVDNLGMAYGISGDLAKSKSTFEYGIAADPRYPMFHYNMACYYGESNDMDHALQELKAAFDNRSHVIAGEGMPDPRQDDSFRNFLKDPKFQTATQQMCPKSSDSGQGYVCSQ